MKTKLHYVLSMTMLLLSFSALAQNSSWKKIESVKNPENLSKFHLNKNKVQLFELNFSLLKKNIASATKRGSNTKQSNATVSVPISADTFETFKVYETSTLSPSLAAKFPDIKSYTGVSINNPKMRLRMSVSPQGIQTMISNTDNPYVFMQPVSKGSNQYVLYDKRGKTNGTDAFKCASLETLHTQFNKTEQLAKTNDEGGANDQTLRKFRLAISTTAEYTAYHDDGFGGNGNAVADALAAINATITRVNEVFETDMSITFEIVDATQLIYTDAATDPYSDAAVGVHDDNANNLNGWGLQLQKTLSDEIGNAAYDIGHLFGASGGGGNAGCLGCVCRDDNTSIDTDKNKGAAYTSPSDEIPEGDTFDLNFVAHEIGHQMGANHTWAFDTEGSGVNSEPGSGSTIMAYAGITGADDIQNDSDPYFHYHSIRQILNTILNNRTCWQNNSVYNPGDITNNPPIADAGNDYIIPAGTPYMLIGSANDSDGSDVLTYCWEQTDSGEVDYSNFSSTLVSGPMNRSLLPSSSPVRYIPRLSSVLKGNITQSNPGLGSDWETVATVDRTLNWALTVRDRDPSSPTGAQSSFDTMQIQIIDGTTENPVGPFQVTSQATTGISWTQGETIEITWDVAGTNGNGINTSQVDILLSTDGGLTFPTILANNVNNDGSQNITVPIIAAPFCRVMVKPVNNIYYSVNPIDFAIGYTVTTTCNQQFISDSNLNVSIPDGIGENQTGPSVSNTINVPSSGIISNIKVNVDISHSYIGDLTVTLTHPNNTTTVKLWDRNCNEDPSNEDFDIVFEDGANGVMCNDPTTGTFSPAMSLNAFNDLDSEGDWTLTINDNYIGDTGTLNDWYLEFCTTTTTLNNPNFIGFENLKVFPNPNNGSFTITTYTATKTPMNVYVHDIRNRLIYSKTFDKSELFSETIDLENARSGMYILTISNDEHKTVKKIIVK
ncbi:reprolysin-like metallopeptidase [Snuella lapsa]